MAIKIAGVEVINDNRELVLAQLTEINESIDDNAVDVFIYDTSKDTDGGAWRHRTQHTSWYNEGASSIRGSRKEFPAVAVIVAEDHTITIYDGDDPSLPMWMIFPANTGALGGVSAADKDLTSVAMLNGVLVGGYGNGLSYVNFLSEVLERGSNTNTSNVGVFPFNVSERDQTPVGLGGTLNLEIVNSYVNDVAMTVLPDAPTDPATGIAVPTIAVASDGGVSVIKDDGTVVDIHDGSSVTGWVDFTDDGQIFFNEGGSVSAVNSYVGAIPSADVTSNLASNFQRYRYDQAPYLNPVQALDGAIVAGGNLVYRKDGSGANAGLSILAPLPTNPTGGLVAAVTSSYTTGWMNGDIKLAALADTTAETLAGPELVVDGSGNWVGDFDVAADVSEWVSREQGVLTWSSGAINIAGDGGFTDRAELAITTEVGKVYKVTADYVGGTTNGRILVREGSGSLTFLEGVVSSSPETVTFYFVATTTSTFIQLEQYAAGSGNVTYDNISVRLADPDRSVNGKGLAVHGSITKAAVATGADVVAYSGFSSSNYLEQPYNADLDFGTGDFCVMGWAKWLGGNSRVIVGRGEPGSSVSPRWLLHVEPGGSYSFFASGTYYTAAYTLPNGAWAHVCAVRTGGVLKLYLNGIEVKSAAMTADLSNANATLRIGLNYLSAQQWDGSLALIRISATAPTADQIKKIYEDEKVLFQEGAKATLYGTSDAVTALAHDPVTDLLHVGTSSGRSVFQGLRRVEESTGTDSQSLAAISAVDGLVVEGK